MPINFPNTPTPNQQYTYSGKTWQWNGTYWDFLVASPGVSSITAGSGLSANTSVGAVTIITTGTTGGSTFTGGTVSGATNFTNGLSANTFSATTYLNLPSSSFTGGTVTGPTNFTNGLSANTFSAQTITTTGLTGSVALISQRNAIPTSLRYWGMLCEVYADTNPDNNGTYKLTYNYANTTLSDNNNWALSLDAYSLTLCF